MLVLAGKVAFVGAPNGSTQLRVDMYVNWEYTSDNRVPETAHGSKDINERYLAFKALATADLSMGNAEHINWIKVILGGAAGFFLGGPVGAVIGATAGAGISLGSALLK